MAVLRHKVQQRVQIKNTGDGFYTLKKNMLSSFVDQPARLTESMFERAMISMNFNMSAEHVHALFSFYSHARYEADEVGRYRVEVYCILIAKRGTGGTG
jgi:hypothetical protein